MKVITTREGQNEFHKKTCNGLEGFDREMASALCVI